MTDSMSLFLMNPGPVNVSERVRQALLGADLCHREDEYYDLQDEIRALLLDVFGLGAADWAAVLVTGSGTAALEMAISSSVSPGGRMLVVDNGVYGDRVARIAEAHWIAHERVVSAWTDAPDLAGIEAALAGARYEVVAAVHHETTTGLINPIGRLAELAHAHGAALVVDSISGLAGEQFDFEADLVVGTANKCVQGLPGVSFALGRRDFLGRIAGYPPRSLYLHLPNQLAHQERRSTPFTPAIQVSYALREALLELREETVAGRIARYRRAAATLRAGFERLALSYLLPADLRSNTITSLELPPSTTYQSVHDALKARGYVIYAGQGGLAATAFRVANMGQIPDDALIAFESHLAAALGRIPAPVR
jgi:2-aminoethylphosphonate-pyruvate transaminase